MTSFKLQGAKKTKFRLALGASSTYDVLAWKSFKKKLWVSVILQLIVRLLPGT